MNGTDRSWVCAIRGPITLMVLGALFALNNFTPYRFDQTWPVLLIVFGLLSILRRTVAPPPPAQAPPYPSEQASHGYRDSRYQQNAEPAGAAAPAPPTTGGTL